MRTFLTVQRMPRSRVKKPFINEAAVIPLACIAMGAMLIGSYLFALRAQAPLSPSPAAPPSITMPAATLPPPIFQLLDASIVDEPDSRLTISRAGGMVRASLVHDVTLTAYCSCPLCCGKWAEYGVTASGAKPKAGHTIAHETLPFGTRVMIEQQVYTVEDRGVFGNSVDIYFDTHEEALAFGRQQGVMVILPDP